MKSVWKKVLVVIGIFLLALTCSFISLPSNNAFGDPGGFAGSGSYSSGGGGSSHSSGGSGHSSSSNDYDDDDDDYLPYGNIYDDTDGGNLTGGMDWSVIIIAIIVVLVVVVISVLKARSSGMGDRNTNSMNVGERRAIDEVRYVQDNFDKSKLQPMEKASVAMPDFNEEQLNEHISNLYVRMQTAWTAKNFQPMEPYFKSEFYAQLASQLAAMVQRGQTNYVANVAVLNVDCEGWWQENGKDHVSVIVQTRINDWTEDDNTKQLISGDRNIEKFMTYRYIMTRTSGQQVQQGTTTNCPNCGGVVDVNQSAECPYCHTIVRKESFGWVVESIQGIEQINT